MSLLGYFFLYIGEKPLKLHVRSLPPQTENSRYGPAVVADIFYKLKVFNVFGFTSRIFWGYEILAVVQCNEFSNGLILDCENRYWNIYLQTEAIFSKLLKEGCYFKFLNTCVSLGSSTLFYINIIRQI